MRDDQIGIYDHLIDAEREALARGGKPAGKIPLIKALREAAGLGLKDAKDVVEDYLARRSGPGAAGGPAGWIDDLLDAECAGAAREGRPLTRILLIRSVRGASPMGRSEATAAVDDYLRRRGGEGLRADNQANWPLILLIVAALLGALAYWLTG